MGKGRKGLSQSVPCTPFYDAWFVVHRHRQDQDMAATMQSDEIKIQEELRKRQVPKVDILVVMSSCSCHMQFLFLSHALPSIARGPQSGS